MTETLSNLPAGTCGIIQQFKGGRDFASRAAALGFTIGAEVTVLQNYGHGPILIGVLGTRIALGRGEASKIQVVTG
jgi:ferrous iron transport protein A